MDGLGHMFRLQQFFRQYRTKWSEWGWVDLQILFHTFLVDIKLSIAIKFLSKRLSASKLQD